jgi:NADPH:quinone reductase-like Zn-dependent oxidoreductase
MAIMKAVRIHQYGGSDQLRYEDAPTPVPEAGEVLVRVHAAGVNPVDWKMREGYMKDMIPHAMPLTLGLEVSGTIEAVTAGVQGFNKGDAVYGRMNMVKVGGYAEYAVASPAEITRKPASIDHVHAAGVSLAGLTAWQSLFDAAAIDLAPGQTILIHGGAGGVGSLAVQLAHWRGAKVLATASTRNQEFLRELGADVAIDYSKQRFEEVAKGVDAVLDTVGGDTEARSYGVVKPGGVFASLVGPPSADKAKALGLRAMMVIANQSEPLKQLSELIDRKQLKPFVSEVLPLADARKAHELSQSGHVRGKIVLRVAD